MPGELLASVSFHLSLQHKNLAFKILTNNSSRELYVGNEWMTAVVPTVGERILDGVPPKESGLSLVLLSTTANTKSGSEESLPTSSTKGSPTLIRHPQSFWQLLKATSLVDGR